MTLKNRTRNKNIREEKNNVISSSPEVSSTAQLAQVRTETLYVQSQTSNEPEATLNISKIMSAGPKYTRTWGSIISDHCKQRFK